MSNRDNIVAAVGFERITGMLCGSCLDEKGVDWRSRRKVWGSKSPPGYTWHHMRDGKTMQLVPYEIHRTFTHSGGVADLPK